MTSQRWERIKSALSVALETDPARMSSCLDNLCGDDSALRLEVENLLALKDDPELGLLESAAVPLAMEEAAAARSAWIGRRVGSYEIVEEIGAGGMGEVYRAIRADDQFHKQVAIKLVRVGYDSDFIVARFRTERQVLAGLEHPNIARLLDGGTTKEGIPYFAMELIDGQPLYEYCDSRELNTSDRLRLFLQICSAVQYAHQRLIVHRDLKPGNILVTADGTPKLLDFGIAKILESASTSESSQATETIFRFLTPEYASPEQIRGEAVTTSSDVYSLGLLLYEILTGHRPYRAIGDAPHEIARAICETVPERPSAIVLRSGQGPKNGTTSEFTPAVVSAVREETPQKLSRRLRGDLDNILLTALRKEPGRRYASVEQMANDIRRHLEHLPVSATSDTVGYRVSKFITRNKKGVAAAALIVLVVFAGTAASLHEAYRARQNELRAERRFNDVRALANSLLFDIHDAVRDLPGSTPVRKLIVQKAQQYLDSLSSEVGDDPSLQRELATAYERVGEVQGHFLMNNLGETENALHSYEKALRLREAISSSPGSSWQDKLAVARCSRLVATQLQATGKVRGGLEAIQKSISLAEPLRQQHPQEISILSELSQDYGINAYLHRGGGVFPGLVDPAEESESRHKAISVDEDWLKLAPSSDEAQHALAWDQVNYAETLGPEKQDEALGYLLHSLEIEKQIRAHTNSADRAREIVSVYNRLGMFYDRIGDNVDSLKSHRSALNIEQECVLKDPQNQHYVENLAVDHDNIAESLLKTGQFEESKAEIAKGIEVMEGLVRDSPENASYQIMLSEMQVTQAQILRRSNHPAAALSEYEVAVTRFRGLLEKDSGNMGPHLSVATCNMGIAKAELQLKRPNEAAASFRAALDSLTPLISNNKPDRRILYIAADAYAGLGRIEAAQASHSATKDAGPHWEAARNSFRMSLEQLLQISQAKFHVDNDVDLGPVDIEQVKKELSRSEAALRSSMPDSAGRR